MTVRTVFENGEEKEEQQEEEEEQEEEGRITPLIQGIRFLLQNTLLGRPKSLLRTFFVKNKKLRAAYCPPAYIIFIQDPAHVGIFSSTHHHGG